MCIQPVDLGSGYADDGWTNDRLIKDGWRTYVDILLKKTVVDLKCLAHMCSSDFWRKCCSIRFLFLICGENVFQFDFIWNVLQKVEFDVPLHAVIIRIKLGWYWTNATFLYMHYVITIPGRKWQKIFSLFLTKLIIISIYDNHIVIF